VWAAAARRRGVSGEWNVTVVRGAQGMQAATREERRLQLTDQTLRSAFREVARAEASGTEALDIDALLSCVARLGVHKYRPVGMAAGAAVRGIIANLLGKQTEQEVVDAANSAGALPRELPPEAIAVVTTRAASPEPAAASAAGTRSVNFFTDLTDHAASGPIGAWDAA
jgi:hypothetical protein